MKRLLFHCLTSSALTLSPTLLDAQATTSLLREGDLIPGVGTVRVVRSARTNGLGDHLVLATVATSPYSVLLHNGAVAFREGAPLTEPAGAVCGKLSLGEWVLEDRGNLLALLPFTQPAGSVETGLFWNSRLIAQTNGLLSCPPLHAATTWAELQTVRVTADDSILVFGELDVPDIVGRTEEALIKIDVDGSGNVISKEVLALEGDVLPGSTAPFLAYRTGFTPLRACANRGGHFIWTSITANAIEEVRIGVDQIVANTGTTFFVPQDPLLDGRSIVNFGLFHGDINDLGSYIFSAALNASAPGLSGSDTLLILDGEKFVQEGDVLPFMVPGESVGDLRGASVYVADSGDVFWAALVNGAPNGQNYVYMRNREVLVREGDSLGGDLVEKLSYNGFQLSRNGRFWVGTARIAPDTDVAYQVDFGSIVPVPGQGLNAGTLRRASGDALAGATVTLEVDGGQALGVVPYFVLSGMEVAAIVPFGEIFVGGALGYSTIGPLWSGSAVQFDVSIPNEIGLVDTVWIGQASFIDVAGVLPGAMVRLTNGLRFEVGAP